MKRLVLILALLSGVLATPAQAANLAAKGAVVRVTACQPALDPAARSATFEGTMRGVPHATKLAMKFLLQTRFPGHPGWRQLKAEGFGAWFTSNPGVPGYVYDKQVANLAAPADYRTVVRFRWVDEKGRTIRSTRLVSPTCHQPDLRPDLVVAKIDVQAAKADGKARYAITIRNRGRTGAASAFDLAFTIDGAVQPATGFLGLASGAKRVVIVVGPRCRAGAPITATVDTGAAVDEAGEANNTRNVACPARP